MTNSTGKPKIGNWYQRSDSGERFQVVSVDAGTVQIQSFDGQLDSIDTDDWEDQSLAAAAAPEDWTGALEDVEADDITEDDSPSDRLGVTDRDEDLRG